MSAVLNPQQWQQLSEYLDGKNPQDERAYVEKQLAASEEWQFSYETLQNTRRALQTAPRRRAPRNFTLTAAQAAAIRKPARSILLFRWSSAFSTGLAAVFVALGIFFTNSAPAAMMAQDNALMPAAAPAPVEMESSAVTAADEPVATAVPIIIWGSPDMNPYLYSGNGGRGGGGGGAAMDSAEVASAPVEKSARDTGPMTAMESEGAFTVEIQSTETVATEMLTVGAEPLTGSGPILGVQSTLAENDLVSPMAPQDASPMAAEPVEHPEQKPWYWLAGGMAVVAVVTALIGWKKR